MEVRQLGHTRMAPTWTSHRAFRRACANNLEETKLQVFHCLKPSSQGGHTLLVDGFATAERLRTERADLFRVLAEMAIEHHYVEAGKLHARSIREPIIREFPRAEKIAQIRYNPYDRAPMRTLAMGGEETQKSAIGL